MLTGVLYYDTYRDVAVARISKTSIDGETVRFFPYIEIGDSDALSGGDIIYTIGSPLGLQDSISSGIVGNKLRVVDDPLYPCIQFTAPISSGSSGGVLLNVYGEAVGILYGSYSRGQGLNLAVPINAISEVSFVGEGIPLTTVCQQEDAKKAASTLTASSTDIVISEGEETDVVISHDCPGNVSIFFIIDDTNIVSCTWGEFTLSLIHIFRQSRCRSQNQSWWSGSAVQGIRKVFPLLQTEWHQNRFSDHMPGHHALRWCRAVRSR